MIKSGLDELSPKRLVPQRGEVVFILGEVRWCGLALAAVRDLREWRITIAGHNQRLSELTHRALLGWLAHRRATWPHGTVNFVICVAGMIDGLLLG